MWHDGTLRMKNDSRTSCEVFISVEFIRFHEQRGYMKKPYVSFSKFICKTSLVNFLLHIKCSKLFCLEIWFKIVKYVYQKVDNCLVALSNLLKMWNYVYYTTRVRSLCGILVSSEPCDRMVSDSRLITVTIWLKPHLPANNLLPFCLLIPFHRILYRCNRQEPTVMEVVRCYTTTLNKLYKQTTRVKSEKL